jgi:hypothetical protein
LRHLNESVVTVGAWCIAVAVHLGVSIHRLTIHLAVVHAAVIHVAVHAWTTYLRAVEGSGQGAHRAVHSVVGHLPVHLTAHGIVVHRTTVQVLIHRAGEGGAIVHASNANLRSKLCTFVLLAHAVDVWPEAFFQPAYLAENFFATYHLLLAITGGCDVGELVDKRACRIDEFGKGGRCPVRNECLVEGNNVGVGGGSRE